MTGRRRSAAAPTGSRPPPTPRRKQRAETLSGYASKAQKQSAKIQLHAWVLPVAAGVYHLTARFGDYSSLWSNFHTGLDFAAPTGTPIMAVAGGTITETGYSGAYGNRTIETLPDGTELWYCHQNEFGTSVGDTVRPGEVIGYVGSTGNVTGPHLHLEVHPGGGDPVDPFTALEVHGLIRSPAKRRTTDIGGRAATATELARSRRSVSRPGDSRAHVTTDEHGTRLQLLDRRVPQQQALDALGPEVDRGDGLVAHAVEGHDRAHPERVVHDPVTGRQGRHLAGRLGLGGRVGASRRGGEVAPAGRGRGASPEPAPSYG